MLLATAVSAGGSSLWAQHDDTAAFPKEFRKWAHVKSVLVGSQSADFATKGESTTFMQATKPLRAGRARASFQPDDCLCRVPRSEERARVFHLRSEAKIRQFKQFEQSQVKS